MVTGPITNAIANVATGTAKAVARVAQSTIGSASPLFSPETIMNSAQQFANKPGIDPAVLMALNSKKEDPLMAILPQLLAGMSKKDESSKPSPSQSPSGANEMFAKLFNRVDELAGKIKDKPKEGESKDKDPVNQAIAKLDFEVKTPGAEGTA